MSWNHRVIRKVCPKTSEEYFEIHEIYYHDNGEVSLWSEDPIPPSGSSMEELKRDIELFLKALEKPVINYEDLPKTREDESCDKSTNDKIV